KNMLRENPEALRGVDVFMEAPAGMPVFEVEGTLPYHPERPDLLRGMMTPRDLSAFWRTKLPTEAKARFTWELLTQKSMICTDGRRVTAETFVKARGKFLQKLEKRVPSVRVAEDPVQVAAADLTGAGGTRTDDDGVRKAIDAARRIAEIDM